MPKKVKSKKAFSNNILITQVMILLIILVSWQMLGHFGYINTLFTGVPTEIIKKLWELLYSGAIYKHLLESFLALFLGLIIGTLLGVIAGLLVGSSEKATKIASPFIFALNSIPAVVFIPVIIISMGVGLWSKILVVLIMNIPTMLSSTIDGVVDSDKSIHNMARSYGAGKITIIKTITFYAALPNILTGLKLSVGKGLAGVIIAEFMGIGKGVGYLISYYGATLKADQMMAVVFITVAISICLTKYVEWVAKRILINYN
jgi:NitT/TauT family transport system permease protein